MKKKNLIVIALASTALAIGGGVALASSMAPKAIEVKAETNKTFGFWNTSDWNPVDAYAWLSSDDSKKNANWPGVAATDTGSTFGGHKLYSYNFDVDKWDRLIFNKGTGGDGNQTANLEPTSLPSYSVYDYSHTGWAIPRSWGLCGKLNGSSTWVDDVQTENVVPWTQTNATFTVTLRAYDEFKFRADGAWTTDISGSTIAASNGTYFETEGTNAKVKAGKSGVYTIKIDWNVEAAGGSAITVESFTSIPDWKMVGEGVAFPDVDDDGVTSWDFSDGIPTSFNPGNLSEVKIENVTLTAGDVFKISDNSKWFGWSDVKSASPLKDCFESDSGNIKVKTGKTGSYTFFVDTTKSEGSGDAIWITGAIYVAIDGWCENFMKVNEFCDAGDTDWATYAASFAALDPDAQDIFNKATANADEHASNIERAAARYDYAVGTKGKTAFAGGSRAKNALFISPMSKGTDNGGVAAVAVTAVSGVAAAVGVVFIRRRRVL